jgi:hypothetical protein
MKGYVNAVISVDELDPSWQIEYDATDGGEIHIFHHRASLFFSEEAFNELIQLVQQSQREKKTVRPHREEGWSAGVSQ